MQACLNSCETGTQFFEITIYVNILSLTAKIEYLGMLQCKAIKKIN